MQHNDYLFPSRREFLHAAGVGAAGLALGGGWEARADEKDGVKIGAGKQTYSLDEAWGKLPEGMKYGHGCAVVVDSQDRVIVTSRSNNPCVAIFDKEGKLLETWSKEFAEAVGYEKPEQVSATAHGLYLSKEGEQEFLYWTENAGGGIGARVYKTDLKGKRLHTIGKVAKESETEQKFDFTNPTDVAVAPNGDIYVVDGYGSQLLYRFDKNFKHIKTVGGRGSEHGKFGLCHGIWIRTLGKEPEIYIADRNNNRLEVFSLEMEYKRTVSDLRNPCCFYQHDGLIYVPELGARVTILDADDKVVARLGDGQGVKPADLVKAPDKFGFPHAMTVASNGDFYVVEWIDDGRVRKFKYTPSA